MNLPSYVSNTQAFEISQQKSDKMGSLEFVAGAVYVYTPCKYQMTSQVL